MNLYHLRYFFTLAQLEHYTKAAEILAITQPSLSHAITNLEKELGVRLFEKEGRNVVLTKYGKQFYTDVENALFFIDNAVNRMQMAARGEGIIDVACVRVLGTNLVPKLIRKFKNAFPDKKIKFSVHTDTGLSGDILKGIKNKKYDLAFCSKLEEDPLIEFTPVSRQSLVIAVPNDHPLAHRHEISLEETLDYPYIIFKKGSGLRFIIDGLFEKIDAYPKNIAYEVEEDLVAAGFVAQGFGIAVLPQMETLKTMNLKLLSLTSPSWERIFYMAALKNSYQLPVVKNFYDFIKKNAEL